MYVLAHIAENRFISKHTNNDSQKWRYVFARPFWRKDKLELSPPATPYTAYTDVRAPDREHKFVRDNMILNSQTRNSWT